MSNLGFINTFEKTLADLQKSILLRGDLPHISVRDQLNCVDELVKFPLGRVLIEKRSIDSFWTDVIMAHDGRKSCFNLEAFLLTRSPFTIAWRELLKTFQNIIQDCLQDSMTLASIPCGAMREILELDYSSIDDFKIIGVDIDAKALFLAQQLAEKQRLSKKLSVHQWDAWQLPYVTEIDIITSCGLNIYIQNPDKVMDLYRQFFKALKPNGKLILGFLTYPPGKDKPSEWQLQKIPEQDLFLETILYEDILGAQWRNFRTSGEIEQELREVGFSEISFFYDSLHVFPTVVAEKNSKSTFRRDLTSSQVG